MRINNQISNKNDETSKLYVIILTVFIKVQKSVQYIHLFKYTKYTTIIQNNKRNNTHIQKQTIPIGKFVEYHVDDLNVHNNNDNNKYAIVIGLEEMKDNCDFEWNLQNYTNTLIKYLKQLEIVVYRTEAKLQPSYHGQTVSTSRAFNTNHFFGC